MNLVVHFEMPAEDRGRMIKFYEQTFGWKSKQMGKDMGEYVVVTTTETDENNMIKNPEQLTAVFTKRPMTPSHNILL